MMSETILDKAWVGTSFKPDAHRSTEIEPQPKKLSADLGPWSQIGSQHQESIDNHGNYWWHRCGYVLAVLLANAKYTRNAQLLILDFFSRSIVPRLGIAALPGVDCWKSFMTDDHCPMEFSWDWGTGEKQPTVRFSFEPVGRNAGTPDDPFNDQATKEVLKEATDMVPVEKMGWFHHFESFFAMQDVGQSLEHHQSKMFWAYDLVGDKVVRKAYFFPGHRAAATGQTNMQTISDAINTAPCCSPENLGALCVFQDYVRERTAAAFEMDMLAIDLLEPSQSRLKIYFRSRDTSFQSVCDIITLGGRLTKGTEKGIQGLRRLWDSLFNQHHVPDDQPLPACNHRTAGILYYVEMRIGSNMPKVKVYLPVRHYAKNDLQVMNALRDYMDSATSGKSKDSQSSYYDAMTSIFGSDVLQHEKGKHTYVACSIEQSGQLRVMSYINPKLV